MNRRKMRVHAPGVKFRSAPHPTLHVLWGAPLQPPPQERKRTKKNNEKNPKP